MVHQHITFTKQILGPFWSEWSEPYGCSESDTNPFGPDKVEGTKNFCRFRDTDIIPDAVQWKFCTLPDLEATSPFVYGTAGRTVNGYYSPDENAVPTITSKHSTSFPFFDDFVSAKSDWHSVAAPTGDADQLKGWTALSSLYINDARRNVYDDFTTKHSTRIACDARLAFAAKRCYEGAFTVNGNFLGGIAPFCDTWTLAAVTDKGTAAACAEAVTAVNQLGDSENPIQEALTLLIEERLQELFHNYPSMSIQYNLL